MNDRILKFTLPIQRGEMMCKATPPWFVDGSEYEALNGSFTLLINGQEAFGAVHRAIAAAKKSVSIICWGFQPSMYFIRNGKEPCIGELLEKKAKEGVQIRVLCWAFHTAGLAINATGVPLGVDESNTPGRWILSLYDRPETATDWQYDYDKDWFHLYDRKQPIAGYIRKKILSVLNPERPMANLKFTSRGFSVDERKRISDNAYEDKGLGKETKGALAAAPSHHQKMVLVDYEDSENAIGFVMGHNMLDAYWDTNDHSAWPRSLYRTKTPEAKPNAVANGLMPRHDFSSRVSGPLLGDLYRNFAEAWKKETGESMPSADFSSYPCPSKDDLKFIKGQILRTQPQYGRKDIKQCYLQAANNATQYIYIENQYFRWPPFAEKIKEAASRQTGAGRKPEEHGNLYLFVITNSTDTGVGAGTVNTYRMLDALGKSNQIPGVARDEKLEHIDKQLKDANKEVKSLENERAALDQQSRLLQGVPNAAGAITNTYQTVNEKLDAAKARKAQLEKEKERLKNGKPEEVIKPKDIPGLKCHVCTLVAPDTKAGEPWMEVYIHAKLMLIDDTFMTLGSANINTRSMEVDSELNIAHHRPEITGPARQRLWNTHTKGKSGQEPLGQSGMKAAYDKWDDILKQSSKDRGNKQKPETCLAPFLRTSAERSNKD